MSTPESIFQGSTNIEITYLSELVCRIIETTDVILQYTSRSHTGVEPAFSATYGFPNLPHKFLEVPSVKV